MAANQRQKPSGQKKPSQKGRQTAQQTARQAASGARRFADEMGEQASGYLARGASQVRDLTHDREGTAVLVALTAGFGIGLAIGAALGASHSRPQTWRDRIAAEGIGRRLMERVEGIMPDALSDYMHR
jgi:hypothetical protein